jgi:hypothetical protein
LLPAIGPCVATGAESRDGWAGTVDCQCEAVSGPKTERGGPAQRADRSRGCGQNLSELADLEISDLQEREGGWVIADLCDKCNRIRTVAVPLWVKHAIMLRSEQDIEIAVNDNLGL